MPVSDTFDFREPLSGISETGGMFIPDIIPGHEWVS